VARFFTSDQHFGCPAGLYYIFDRPFRNVDEQDYVMVQNWNSVVGKDDDVYILGDVSVGDNLLQVVPFLSVLNGNKKLVLGHHDYVEDVSGMAYKNIGVEVFASKVISLPFEVNGETVDVLLSHYPYSHSGTSNPYSHEYVPFNNFTPQPLLHGHRHHASPLNPYNKWEYNVSVDSHNFTPVHESVIVEWLEKM
jgi:calcineurin-like phosphoesterase family protein